MEIDMNRRDFFKTSTALAGVGLLPVYPVADAQAAAAEAGWRIFELTTKIDIPATAGATRAWLPLPSVYEADWIHPMGNIWQGNAGIMRVLREPKYGLQMLYAEWTEEAPHTLELTSRFAAHDRKTDFTQHRKPIPLTKPTAKLYTQPTRLLPTDGIVRAKAREITKGAIGDEEKAQAIYEWVVENTFRNPKTPGCGLGDIRFMLETGDLGGKCADLNALYVGLARSVGLPARDVYGVRVTESRMGFKCLGKSGDVSKGQHCRAEVYLSRYGWVPVDPADVRKVALEEPPGHLSLADEPVQKARKLLFGGWEMNWLAYNFAHDVRLPHSSGRLLPFLMYPQAEVNGRRLDSLDPAGFKYQLTSRELTV
jgi:transglutaminase-like putative cysteine protease